jgi:hypothetical protein
LSFTFPFFKFPLFTFILFLFTNVFRCFGNYNGLKFYNYKIIYKPLFFNSNWKSFNSPYHLKIFLCTQGASA